MTRWDRWPAKAALILFIIAHSQDVRPLLAPLSALVLAGFVFVRQGRWPRVAGKLLGLVAFLLAVSILNGSIGHDLVNYFRRNGGMFYTLSLLLLFLRATGEPGFTSTAMRLGFKITALLGAIYLFALKVTPLSIAGQPMLSPRHTILGLQNGKNPTAGLLGVFAVVGIVHFMRRERLTSRYWMDSFATALLALMVFFTQSRGYSLALGATVLYVLMGSRRRMLHSKLVVRALVALAVILFGSTLIAGRFSEPLDQDANVVTRLALWQRGLDRFAESPLTGFGVGSFEQTDFESEKVMPGVAVRTAGEYLPEIVRFDTEGGLHAHNVYFQLLSEVGLVGFVWFFGLFVGAWRRTRDRTAQGAMFRAMFVYIGIAGLTAGLTFVSPSIAWALMLLTAAAFHPSRRNPESSPERNRARSASA
jgi:O-antigen ligase